MTRLREVAMPHPSISSSAQLALNLQPEQPHVVARAIRLGAIIVNFAAALIDLDQP
jgi:hypothetical protein